MQQVLGVWNSFFRGSISGTASTTSRARYGTTHIWRRKVDIHGQVSEISLFSYIMYPAPYAALFSLFPIFVC